MISVFANGDLEDDGEWTRPFLAQSTTIIAADGGSRHLHTLNHPPDIIIGDMDSLPADVRTWLTAVNAPFIPFPPAKNETDLELALQYAAKNYGDDIMLFAALGGRLDQLLGNIHLLTQPDLVGRVRLVTQYQQAWVVATATNVASTKVATTNVSTTSAAATSTSSVFVTSAINGRIGDTLSLIPLNGDAKIGNTTGLRWSLCDEWLRFGQTRGISNVITAVPAAITLEKGTLLCVHTKKECTR